MSNKKLIKAIAAKFPHDKLAKIFEFIESATEHEQPLTVTEYTNWREYDENGIKKGAAKL